MRIKKATRLRLSPLTMIGCVSPSITTAYLREEKKEKKKDETRVKYHRSSSCMPTETLQRASIVYRAESSWYSLTTPVAPRRPWRPLIFTFAPLRAVTSWSLVERRAKASRLSSSPWAAAREYRSLAVVVHFRRPPMPALVAPSQVHLRLPQALPRFSKKKIEEKKQGTP